MHQQFVTTAPPPMAKGGDYDFSAFSTQVPAISPTPRGKLEVKILLLAPTLAIENLPRVKIQMSQPFNKDPNVKNL